MGDPEKRFALGLIGLFLGGSFLAAVWALDSALLPVAVFLYLAVAVLVVLRIRRAENVLR